MILHGNSLERLKEFPDNYFHSIVTDPFCGSGSTGVAAKNLGFGFVGIEMSAEYVEIAKRRLEA